MIARLRASVRGARTSLQMVVWELAGAERRGTGQRPDSWRILERRADGSTHGAQDRDLAPDSL